MRNGRVAGSFSYGGHKAFSSFIKPRTHSSIGARVENRRFDANGEQSIDDAGPDLQFLLAADFGPQWFADPLIQYHQVADRQLRKLFQRQPGRAQHNGELDRYLFQ